MANPNTITAVYGNSTQALNTTSETVLTRSVNGAATNISLAVPANANVDGHAFRLRLIGKATGGTSATLQLAFRMNSLSGTKFATFTVSGAAIPVAGGNFAVEATLTWDSTSGLLNGTIGGQTNNTITSAAAITQVTGLTAASSLVFVPTATFGAAVATNSVTVEEFSIEQI